MKCKKCGNFIKEDDSRAIYFLIIISSVVVGYVGCLLLS